MSAARGGFTSRPAVVRRDRVETHKSRGTRGSAVGSFLGPVEKKSADTLHPSSFSRADAATDDAATSINDHPGMYLARFGYEASDGETWAPRHNERVEHGIQPQLKLDVKGHKESQGHTWYEIRCELHSGTTMGLVASWAVHRRLNHLRQGLHDPLQKLLNKEYERMFEDTPFAMRGGFQGTTARLREWCSTLSILINAGTVFPSVVALTMRFVECPAERLKVKALAASNAMPMELQAYKHVEKEDLTTSPGVPDAEAQEPSELEDADGWSDVPLSNCDSPAASDC
uniref:Uncharacterized protein n=1 Tax=Noctiluca scintillans TaxID=2966 RepID=A0A7S1FB94_NOCSC|mmetsp:Transcript_47146/g.125251  ORF Transcript_47146/g.125251 Transcript_47146/m.125251 type:complete len:286 (+) Transcript_47146:68-925(+)|eukprot:CAMPEP_0194522058 /NCGR_PEP_ID=MMETSP0253-20130528/56516_1 /TAXON_ID=2966 /ORGANISM="Noctiluca scintillans" /LENGTH=285 /DNA_ID=CAMNT_0039366461 /DNA_START=51 /DNA_END=908 /DNA_ORIENTATION=+